MTADLESVDDTEGSESERDTLEEFLKEVALTEDKYIVVEGASDQGTLETLLRALGYSESTGIVPVEKLIFDASLIARIGLGWGNRAKVIAVAVLSRDEDVDLRCIADRDCGAAVEAYDMVQLLWTDFPALESYILRENILDAANSLNFGNRLPGGGELIQALRRPLAELFLIRKGSIKFRNPRHRDGFSDAADAKSGDGILALENFDSRVAMPNGSFSDMERDALLNSASDPREYAYGHDIAPLIFHAFFRELQKCGISRPVAVENALLSAFHSSRQISAERLFGQLLDWLKLEDGD